MTQKEMILKHMQEVGSITPAEAVKEYGCYRVAARIFELKNEGYDISSTMKSEINRLGKTVSFSEYSLESFGK